VQAVGAALSFQCSGAHRSNSCRRAGRKEL